MNKKKALIKGVYYVEVSGYGGKLVTWEVVEYHVTEEGQDHDEIGLQGFDFGFFTKTGRGVVIEGLRQYPYLMMVMNIWTGNQKNQLININIRVDKDNGKSVGKVNGQAWKVCWFSSNEFQKNIGCPVSYPTFYLGGEAMVKGRDTKINYK